MQLRHFITDADLAYQPTNQRDAKNSNSSSHRVLHFKVPSNLALPKTENVTLGDKKCLFLVQQFMRCRVTNKSDVSKAR